MIGHNDDSVDVKVSHMEAFYLWVIRKNQRDKILEIRKKFRLWKFEFVFSWRSKKNAFGRFGGGWDWKIGFDIGWPTVIINLLIASLRVSYKK